MTVTDRPPMHWARLFLPFAIGYFLSYLLRNANAVIAPELTRDLALTAADLGLLTSAYFIAFGLFQLPLGILLDRYGPRRVESTLLLFAALGTLIFAFGRNIAELGIGRGFIGLGVSACLMAALKNFWQWYPAERQAALSAAIMVAGGLGAVCASVPLDYLVPILGWRGIFTILTFVIAAVAAYLFFAIPDHHGGVSRTSTIAEQWQGVVHVFTNRGFWRFAPQAAFFAGGHMAILGLWAVPWYINVDGLSKTQAANTLFMATTATLVAFLLLAMFTTRLTRLGVRLTWIIATLLGATMIVQGLIVAGIGPIALLWIGYGVCVTGTQLAYAALAERFPVSLSGRANTSLNLMAFAGAFSIQWGFGGIVDMLVARGWETASAYRAALVLLTILQLLAWAWCVLEGRREREIALRGARPPVVPSQ
jgi:sugar phosphate permease